jgi:hypothetical protein
MATHVIYVKKKKKTDHLEMVNAVLQPITIMIILFVGASFIQDMASLTASAAKEAAAPPETTEEQPVKYKVVSVLYEGDEDTSAQDAAGRRLNISEEGAYRVAGHLESEIRELEKELARNPEGGDIEQRLMLARAIKKSVSGEPSRYRGKNAANSSLTKEWSDNF